MIVRPARALLFLVSLAAAAGGCGKKGNPLPPLRPVPARIADLAAHRVDDRIALTFTAPGNADGTTPPATSRVEIYRVATMPGAAAPSAAQILAGGREPIAVIAVRPAAGGEKPPSPAATTAPPTAGERATFVDVADSARINGAEAWSYVAVGVAGRNRRGPVSAAVQVPLSALPPPPDGLVVTSDATSIRVAWDAQAAGRTVRVFAVDRAGTGAPSVLTATPIAGAAFTAPVEFGRERCFAVRAVTVSAATTTEGPMSAPVCTTPVDSYPPPAPAGLQAIQEGAFVTLNWTGVEAADLAGYVVLRGDDEGRSMLPLTRAPIKETTYVDRTARAGATYTYSVYAVDTAPTSNVSEQSNRVTVAVR
ncbi:MAG: hypothetical protein IT184_16480 [Acidobacteria bacterium]|nr:hypothetical protein [Acidobacteriota bacterium]